MLIIGILAAIALPQYQKAVERSRMAEAIQVLGDWANAQSIYYMQNNAFAEDINEGDIALATPGDAFEYDGGIDRKEGFAFMEAQRASGMYARGILSISIDPDGTIYKFCDGPEGFCTMAKAAGYQADKDSNDDNQNTGGNNGGSDSLCLYRCGCDANGNPIPCGDVSW